MGSAGPSEPCDILVRNGYVLTVDARADGLPVGRRGRPGQPDRGGGTRPGREPPASGPPGCSTPAARPVHPGMIDGHLHSTCHLTRTAFGDDPAVTGGTGLHRVVQRARPTTTSTPARWWPSWRWSATASRPAWSRARPSSRTRWPRPPRLSASACRWPTRSCGTPWTGATRWPPAFPRAPATRQAGPGPPRRAAPAEQGPRGPGARATSPSTAPDRRPRSWSWRPRSAPTTTGSS